MGWKRSARWLPFVLWAGVILRGALDPDPPDPWFDFPHADKVIHLLFWGALAAMARWAMIPAASRPLAAVLAWVLSVGHGAAVEALQAPLATRSSEGLDLVADALGAVLGVYLVDRWEGRHGTP